MPSYVKLYLDTNIYCRPLDDQEDIRINAETKAILEIISSASEKKLIIISSDYVKFEIQRIERELKRKTVIGIEGALCQVNIPSGKKITGLAKYFMDSCNIGALDSLHVAAACIAKVDFLITCDDEVTDTASCIEKIAYQKGHKIKVRNPIKYLKERGN